MRGKVLGTISKGLLPVCAEGLSCRFDEKLFGVVLMVGGGVIPGFFTGTVQHVVWKATQAFGTHRFG